RVSSVPVPTGVVVITVIVVVLVAVLVSTRGLDGGGALTELGRPHAVAEFARPLDDPFVGSDARRRSGPHPSRRVVVVAVAPVLPWHLLGAALVVDQELFFGVDGVLTVGEGELEQLRLGDRLGRTRLDAHVAVDAAQVVDLVDET